MPKRALLVGVWASLILTPLFAQNPSYLYRSSSAETTADPIELSFFLDSSGLPLQGWSIGVCHDPAMVEIDSVVSGLATLTSNGGEPPDFDNPAVFPGEGWTTGVVLNFFGESTLAPGLNYELNRAIYVPIDTQSGETEIEFCDTLGGTGTPVTNIVVEEMGNSETPLLQSGTIEIVPSNFRYRMSSAQVNVPSATGAATFASTFSIQEDSGNPGYPNPVSTFSVAVQNDSLIEPVSVDQGVELSNLNGGAGPDFYAAQVYPGAVTVAALFSFELDQLFEFTSAMDLFSIQYSTVGQSLVGSESSVFTSLRFIDGLGNPPVDNVVVSGLEEFFVTGTAGLIELFPAVEPLFVRGDANVDGSINVADPVLALDFLFSGENVTCLDAIDTNDDGSANIADPIYTLEFLFVGGPPIPAPTATCGPDPTIDTLGCDLFAICP